MLAYWRLLFVPPSFLLWRVQTLKQMFTNSAIQSDFTFSFLFSSLFVPCVYVCVRALWGARAPSCRGPRAPCTCLASAQRTSPGRVQEILEALHVLQSCCCCVGYKAPPPNTHRHKKKNGVEGEGWVFFFLFKTCLTQCFGREGGGGVLSNQISQ